MNLIATDMVIEGWLQYSLRIHAIYCLNKPNNFRGKRLSFQLYPDPVIAAGMIWIITVNKMH